MSIEFDNDWLEEQKSNKVWARVGMTLNFDNESDLYSIINDKLSYDKQKQIMIKAIMNGKIDGECILFDEDGIELTELTL